MLASAFTFCLWSLGASWRKHLTRERLSSAEHPGIALNNEFVHGLWCHREYWEFCFPPWLVFSAVVSLSLFLFLKNDILLFTHLLGCPSAVVINMLPVTTLCGSWCEGADKPGCSVWGSYSGFVRGPLVMVWDLLRRWRAAPFITAFPYSPELCGHYKHYGVPGRTDHIPPQAQSVLSSSAKAESPRYGGVAWQESTRLERKIHFFLWTVKECDLVV